MFSNPQTYIFWLTLTAVIYWLIPHLRFRRIFLLFSSVAFVFSIAPFAVHAAIYMILLPIIWSRIWKWKHNVLTFWLSLFSALLPLIASRSIDDFKTPLFSFGLAFMTVRALGVLLDLYRTKGTVPSLSFALYLFFFPIYSAGPVEHLSTFSDVAAPSKLDPSTLLSSFLRISVGILKTTYISDTLLTSYMNAQWPNLVMNPEIHTSGQAWIFIFLKFAHTYINFSGYSDIAIGSAGILGFNIQENFNFPFLAKNMQEFWKRWHMSMGAWIMRYVFFPLLAIFRTEKASSSVP